MDADDALLTSVAFDDRYLPGQDDKEIGSGSPSWYRTSPASVRRRWPCFANPSICRWLKRGKAPYESGVSVSIGGSQSTLVGLTTLGRPHIAERPLRKIRGAACDPATRRARLCLSLEADAQRTAPLALRVRVEFCKPHKGRLAQRGLGSGDDSVANAKPQIDWNHAGGAAGADRFEAAAYPQGGQHHAMPPSTSWPPGHPIIIRLLEPHEGRYWCYIGEVSVDLEMPLPAAQAL
jgi:hypothetical protein